MILRAVHAVALLAADPVPPLTPDSDEARRWAERELADPVYAAAQPTVLDRIARAVAEFFANLFNGQLTGDWASVLAVVAAAVIVALVVVAFVVWGRPRTAARSRPAAAELFGESDRRSAAELRKVAASHAARGEWNDAIVVRFRALARGLDERGLVDTAPGATVHSFAREAARAFPDAGGDLDASAGAFDDVRYLRRPGTAELYARVAAVDDSLQQRHPESAPLVGAS